MKCRFKKVKRHARIFENVFNEANTDTNSDVCDTEKKNVSFTDAQFVCLTKSNDILQSEKFSILKNMSKIQTFLDRSRDSLDFNETTFRKYLIQLDMNDEEIAVLTLFLSDLLLNLYESEDYGRVLQKALRYASANVEFNNDLFASRLDYLESFNERTFESHSMKEFLDDVVVRTGITSVKVAMILPALIGEFKKLRKDFELEENQAAYDEVSLIYERVQAEISLLYERNSSGRSLRLNKKKDILTSDIAYVDSFVSDDKRLQILIHFFSINECENRVFYHAVVCDSKFVLNYASFVEERKRLHNLQD